MNKKIYIVRSQCNMLSLNKMRTFYNKPSIPFKLSKYSLDPNITNKEITKIIINARTLSCVDSHTNGPILHDNRYSRPNDPPNIREYKKQQRKIEGLGGIQYDGTYKKKETKKEKRIQEQKY